MTDEYDPSDMSVPAPAAGTGGHLDAAWREVLTQFDAPPDSETLEFARFLFFAGASAALTLTGDFQNILIDEIKVEAGDDDSGGTP